MDYLLHHPSSDVNIEEFHKECGVGVVVTADEIKDVVSLTFAALYPHLCTLVVFSFVAIYYLGYCIVSFNHISLTICVFFCLPIRQHSEINDCLEDNREDY